MVPVYNTPGDTMALKDYTKRIVLDPEVHFGKPCVKNTRIPVENVLELVQEDVSFEQITKDYYPDLTIEDVKACVRYATDVVQSEEIHISSTSE